LLAASGRLPPNPPRKIPEFIPLLMSGPRTLRPSRAEFNFTAPESNGKPHPATAKTRKGFVVECRAPMSRVIVIHWNPAEVEGQAARLRRAGYTIETLSPRSGADLRAMRATPPDALVIDLSRAPSQGGAVAVMLRQQKATRHVPIVFAGGDALKVARVREGLPDALYTEWKGIRGALRRALKAPPTHPVVPGTMDAYAGMPLVKKLGIRKGSAVLLLGAPAGFERRLGALPENLKLERQARAPAQVILLFAKSSTDLERRFPAAARALAKGGRLWIVWPKKASGASTDLTQRGVRAFGLARGFVDYKICSIDETWSGLLFARRGS
jgi:CheY-like chemotaxis protein